MTNQFKKGDKVTVREGATSVGGHKADPKEARTVRTVWSDGRVGLHSTGVGTSGNVFEPEDLVPYVETPALLDPAKVKAGDTVTLERDGGRLPDQEVVVVTATEQGWIILILKGAVEVRVTGPDPWLITAHTPAPEPEPEWKPGTFGWADVPAPHGRAHGFLTDRNFVYLVDEPEQDESTGYNVTADFSNFNPDVFLDPAAVDEPRPLPTREALAAAIQGRAEQAGLYSRLFRISPDLAADRVLDLLREARP